jgi:alginate O-acetyltransferase complex protein AlgI
MIFSSIQYLLFLPVVLLLYWRTRGSVRLWLVVLASLFFYMSWLPIYGLLLIAMTTVNWQLALKIHDCFNKEQAVAGEPFAFSSITTEKRAKLLFGLGLAINFGALCYYKYTNFLLTNLWGLGNFVREHSAAAGSHPVLTSSPVLDIALPLGISFFVFEFVHYLFDVYKGSEPIKSFGEFAAFAAFFPSQIAGPIKRFQDFNFKLRHPETWSSDLACEGGALIAQGMFKKIALADPIGAAIAPAFVAGTVPGIDVFVASMGFAIQLYCDFSGYTDIGRGSALLLGIRLPINFNFPYLTRDLIDFWRRWHISLSTWLRDYVFIPLGGSRNGRLMAFRNTFITMVVCGLWHGAQWSYVLFGILHGLAMGANQVWRNVLSKNAGLSAFCESTPGVALSVLTFWCFWLSSLVVFRCPDLAHCSAMFASLLNWHAQSAILEPLARAGVFQIAAVYLLYWGSSELAQRGRLPKIVTVAQNQHGLLFNPGARFASWTAAVILIAAARPTEAVPFVYFQF